jgi:hypothetical protein
VLPDWINNSLPIAKDYGDFTHSNYPNDADSGYGEIAVEFIIVN